MRRDLVPTDQLVAAYRQVFTSRNSEDVLLHILFDLGVFEETENEADVILRNQGIRFLKILGGGEVGKETIREFMKRLVRQPLQHVGDTDNQNMEV